MLPTAFSSICSNCRSEHRRRAGCVKPLEAVCHGHEVGGIVATGTPKFFKWPLQTKPPVLPAQHGPALTWWAELAATISPDDEVVLPPGPRDRWDDFVAKGSRVQTQHIAQVKEGWRRFLDTAGQDPPKGAFKGRGIAILSGSMPYLVPSMIALRALRATGCTLPVEFWFPENEIPDYDVAKQLESLGAQVQVFPFDPEVLGKVRVSNFLGCMEPMVPE
jgi:hypothetical protein